MLLFWLQYCEDHSSRMMIYLFILVLVELEFTAVRNYQLLGSFGAFAKVS